MNEHARSIYQAALDGKTVQIKQDDVVWSDRSPFRMVVKSPIDYPELWRIKPKKRFERRYSRAYFDKELNAAAICHKESDRKIREFEEANFFGGWLTGWLPYTVEVEQ